MDIFGLKGKIIAIGVGIVAVVAFLASVFKAGGDREKVKQLKKENKANEKSNKIEKKLSNVSRSDYHKWLHKNGKDRK